MLEMIARRPREVTVRPTVGAGERYRWDALMGAVHLAGLRQAVPGTGGRGPSTRNRIAPSPNVVPGRETQAVR